jgi:hypothetical protein
MSASSNAKTLWLGLALLTVVSVTLLVGVLLVSSSSHSLNPVSIPIAFSLAVAPIHGLLYAIVATVRLSRGADSSPHALRRAFIAMTISGGINLAVACVLTVIAGGGFGWRGLGLMYFLAIWCAVSLFFVTPIVDFATGGRWMPYNKRTRDILTNTDQ